MGGLSRHLEDSRVVPAVPWGLVVPVKRLALAKTRLAAYGDVARQDLALAFAVDVVTVALGTPGVAQVLVVTDDERAAGALTAVGARVVADSPDAGLNPALEHGAELLRAAVDAGTDVGVATLSADLPALQPAELAAALSAVPAGGRAFVADAAGTGTTLLAAAPGIRLAPGYGPGSRAAHLASGALELVGAPGLRLDVDTPEDLLAALLLGVGAATAAVAARLA
ncbi:MAG: 2-phospho-L-lactate/phosphoenolpyruvate guanylyltransferase [Actinomycetota bacterium]|nr:2-phospho-L-lactate/phosphoenolpyruvate guanylyltransferase [Actinomycetota bacterium]